MIPYNLTSRITRYGHQVRGPSRSPAPTGLPAGISASRQGSASGKRRTRYPDPPRPKGFPKSPAFHPIYHAERPTFPPPAARRYALRADRPAEAFFLLDRARPVLFLSRTKREWGAHCQASNLAQSPRLFERFPRPLPAGQFIQGQPVEIRQCDQSRQPRLPLPALISLIGPPADSNLLRKYNLTDPRFFSQSQKMFRKRHSVLFFY